MNNPPQYPTYAINLILTSSWDAFKEMEAMDQTLRNVKSLLPQDLINSIFSETDLYTQEKHELLQAHLQSITPALMHAVNRFYSTYLVLQSIQRFASPIRRDCEHLEERTADLKMLLSSCNKDVETLKRYEQNLVSLCNVNANKAKDNKRQTTSNPFSPQMQQHSMSIPQPNVMRMSKTPPGNRRNALNNSTPVNPFARVAQSNVSNNYNTNNPIPPFMAPDSPPSQSDLPPAIPTNILSPNTTKKRDRDFERRADYGEFNSRSQPVEEHSQAKTKKQKTSAPLSLHVSLDNYQQRK